MSHNVQAIDAWRCGRLSLKGEDSANVDKNAKKRRNATYENHKNNTNSKNSDAACEMEN